MADSAATWWVYMIKTSKGRLYTGISTDVQRRFRQHKGELKGGAKYFRQDTALEVVYREAFTNRSDASRREAVIKRFNAEKKQALVNGDSLQK